MTNYYFRFVCFANPSATSSSAADLLMSPSVQRRYTMNGSAINRDVASQQLSSFGTISNARSLANLQSQNNHDDSMIESPRNHAAMATSTSVGDLNTSEEDATVRKPILKKDSKYGSRRELPALGVSGVVSKGRPSIFEFWENMLGPQPDPMSSLTLAGGESSDANENNSGSRASMRRVLPPLPGQPQSLTVSTAINPTTCSSSSNNSNGSGELLGSRGEVEGSSNQPSPTCVSGEIDPGYWSSVRSNINHEEMMSTTPVKAHHDLLMDDLNRTKKQLAELQNMVSCFPLIKHVQYVRSSIILTAGSFDQLAKLVAVSVPPPFNYFPSSYHNSVTCRPLSVGVSYLC